MAVEVSPPLVLGVEAQVVDLVALSLVLTLLSADRALRLAVVGVGDFMAAAPAVFRALAAAAAHLGRCSQMQVRASPLDL